MGDWRKVPLLESWGGGVFFVFLLFRFCFCFISFVFVLFVLFLFCCWIGFGVVLVLFFVLLEWSRCCSCFEPIPFEDSINKKGILTATNEAVAIYIYTYIYIYRCADAEKL